MMRLLLIDDHTIVRDGLRILISNNLVNIQIDESDSIRNALVNLMKNEYDLIILDFQLQDGNATDLIKNIDNLKRKPKIIILTAFDDEKTIYACIQKGVQGIILKTSEAKKIIQGIIAVINGATYYEESIMDKLVCYVSQKESINQKLNSNECKILQLLSKGLSNKEIADLMFMSEKTIRNYLSIIYEKIEVKNRIEASIFYQKNIQN